MDVIWRALPEPVAEGDKAIIDECKASYVLLKCCQRIQTQLLTLPVTQRRDPQALMARIEVLCTPNKKRHKWALFAQMFGLRQFDNEDNTTYGGRVELLKARLEALLCVIPDDLWVYAMQKGLKNNLHRAVVQTRDDDDCTTVKNDLAKMGDKPMSTFPPRHPQFQTRRSYFTDDADEANVDDYYGDGNGDEDAYANAYDEGECYDEEGDDYDEGAYVTVSGRRGGRGRAPFRGRGRIPFRGRAPPRSSFGIAVQGPSKPVGGTMRPGDWRCAKCNTITFRDKAACFKCGAPKPTGLLLSRRLQWLATGARNVAIGATMNRTAG